VKSCFTGNAAKLSGDGATGGGVVAGAGVETVVNAA
jgi:hypothetical protein